MLDDRVGRNGLKRTALSKRAGQGSRSASGADTTSTEGGPPAPRNEPVPAGPRTLRLGGRRYPVVLPKLGDPRLHLASVIVSIHVLGQVALGFQVSVVQILVAVLTAAVIEVTLTLRQTGALVWPASAMLTGSGVALIFRVVGTRNGDYWSWRGWYLFALVGGLSLLTKYVIKYRGSHVFNPSNVGLVAAFVILGRVRVEPLDFWWHPLDGWMAAAYVIILVGGLLITARLRLLGMSVAFWAALAAGIGVLAASGHCMTARWSFAPVCGTRFWWVILTSPEILIFLFFMITDPKTVPAGRVGRLAFAAAVGAASTLLIAPQTTEFGAKVGLLGGLAVLSVARLPLGRLLPAADSDRDHLRHFVAKLAWDGDVAVGPRRGFVRGAIVGAAVIVLGSGIVAAGAPARQTLPDGVARAPEVAVEVDRSTLPRVIVDPEVASLDLDLSGAGAQRLAVALAEDLAVEAEALLRGDASLLGTVDFGDRFREMRRRVDETISTGETTVDQYTFDSLRLVPVVATGGQSGLTVGIAARGSLEQIAYGAGGSETGRATSTFAVTFVVGRPTGGRWMIVDTQPAT